MKIRYLSIFILFVFPKNFVTAQQIVPGKSYFSNNNYIEYIAGNTPFIVSVPHGGDLKPNDIPDRNCANCTTVKDGNTQELAREIATAFFKQTGCYPHIIINRLHRIKLDANREIVEAALGNPQSEQAWLAFHSYIDSAKTQITKQFGTGLYIDLHGHGHTIQRLELGYLLTDSELQKTDNQINTNTYINYSSIKNLAVKNLKNATLAQLLRGEKAIGTLLQQRGFPSVPSKQDPFPQTNDDYFSGGYNTNRHGSRLGGKIEGLQIETNFIGVRDTDANRKKFADSLSLTVREFLANFMLGKEFTPCKNVITTENILDKKCRISPNPAVDFIAWDCDDFSDSDAILFDFYGKKIKTVHANQTDISDVENGIYFIKIKNEFHKILIMK
jgi:Secretion system C-terminal sorting domain